MEDSKFNQVANQAKAFLRGKLLLLDEDNKKINNSIFAFFKSNKNINEMLSLIVRLKGITTLQKYKVEEISKIIEQVSYIHPVK